MRSRSMNHLVIGYLGQVGSAIYQLLHDCKIYAVHGTDLIEDKSYVRYNPPIKYLKFNVIHVCIPFTSDFFNTITHMMVYGNNETIIIIHSTVKPGTCNILSQKYKNVVYSPVRGNHENGLVSELQKYKKYYATTNSKIIHQVARIFSWMNISSKGYHGDPTSLEYIKLYNTTWHYMNVVFAEDLVTMSDEKNLDLEIMASFIDSTMDRTVYPYAQSVGYKDHCLEPNAELLVKEGSLLADFLIRRNKAFRKKYGNEKKWIKE